MHKESLKRWALYCRVAMWDTYILYQSYSVLPIQLLAHVPGRQQVWAEVLRHLHSSWETEMELLAPAYARSVY